MSFSELQTFAAIDFETATSKRGSACAVGIVRVEGGRIIEEYSTLIKPPGNEYSGWNIAVHGITPSRTRLSPDFAAVWPEISSRLKGGPIIAHNAPFDRSVLYHAAGLYGLEAENLFPRDVWLCTLKLYKSLGYKPCKLSDCCRAHDIPLNHHDALSDARGCALLALRVRGV